MRWLTTVQRILTLVSVMFFADLFVGGGFAAEVVILRQTVDGDSYSDEGRLCPGAGMGMTALVTIIV